MFADYEEDYSVNQQAVVEGDTMKAIPCWKCTLRGGMQLRPARTPRAALVSITQANDIPRGVKGLKCVRGRGRAISLKEQSQRAHKMMGQSTSEASWQEDTVSSSSSRHNKHPGETVEDFVVSPSSFSDSASWDALSPDRNSPLDMNPTWKTTSTVIEPDIHDTKQMNFNCTSIPPITYDNIQGETTRTSRSKKTKYLPVDLRPMYEAFQSELLVGIPAGSELSARSAGLANVSLNNEHIPCFEPGYQEQRQPKMNSIVEFPQLPKESSKKRQVQPNSAGISFMNSVPKKKESMKSVASFITREKINYRSESESAPVETDVNDEHCSTLVIENVPAKMKRKDLLDLLEPYGLVSRIQMQQVGHTQTAYVSLAESSQGEWMSEILDGSDSLLEADGDGPVLKVYMAT